VFRTLIVDDEPIARQVLRDALDALSDIAIIGEAEDGASAIDLIERFTPDLVFLDLQMPELEGIEVSRRMSARRLPAISSSR
jgi:chemotaxis response regulator CheB